MALGSELWAPNRAATAASPRPRLPSPCARRFLPRTTLPVTYQPHSLNHHPRKIRCICYCFHESWPSMSFSPSLSYELQLYALAATDHRIIATRLSLFVIPPLCCFRHRHQPRASTAECAKSYSDFDAPTAANCTILLSLRRRQLQRCWRCWRHRCRKGSHCGHRGL